jgi:chromosome segregation ATPase
MSAEATELEKAREEIAHLTAKLSCAEEEKTELANVLTDHRRAFEAERDAVQRHIDMLAAKLRSTEEIAVERGRQLEMVVKEHGNLTQEVGRLHMETRHLKEVLMRVQQENNELKSQIQQVSGASVTACAPEPRVMARITPHDKKEVVHAELEAAPSTIRATGDTPLPKRKPGL